MAIPFKKLGYKINPITDEPTVPQIFLYTRRGTRIGQLTPVDNLSIDIKELNQADEISFTYYKEVDGVECPYFDLLEDLSVIYIEGLTFFEISTSIKEEKGISKSVTGTQLAFSELSQLLGTLSINTEEDIKRPDYDVDYPTLFYRDLTGIDDEALKKKLKESSLIHRVLTYAPNYTIGHISPTLKYINRTFEWSDSDLVSIFNDIGTEVGCVFYPEININEQGEMVRTINCYDSQYCKYCWENNIDTGEERTDEEKCTNYTSTFRNIINGVCQHCMNEYGSNVVDDSGEKSNIFITTENLASEINIENNKDELKNCFSIKGGDDLMTDTVQGLIMSGDGKIVTFSDAQKNKMSPELLEILDDYNEDYNENINYYDELLKQTYNVDDLILYLQSGKMPQIERDIKSLDDAVVLLLNDIKDNFNNTFYIKRFSIYSNTSASSSIKEMLSGFITKGYNFTVNTSSITAKGQPNDTYYWGGTIKLFSIEEPSKYYIITVSVNSSINTSIVDQDGNTHFLDGWSMADKNLLHSFHPKFNFADVSQETYMAYIEQYLNQLMASKDLEYKNEMKKDWGEYCYNRLENYYDGYDACINVIDTMMQEDNNDTSIEFDKSQILKEIRNNYLSLQMNINTQMSILEDQIYSLYYFKGDFTGSKYASPIKNKAESEYKLQWYDSVAAALESIQKEPGAGYSSGYHTENTTSIEIYKTSTEVGIKFVDITPAIGDFVFIDDVMANAINTEIGDLYTIRMGYYKIIFVQKTLSVFEKQNNIWDRSNKLQYYRQKPSSVYTIYYPSDYGSLPPVTEDNTIYDVSYAEYNGMGINVGNHDLTGKFIYIDEVLRSDLSGVTRGELLIDVGYYKVLNSPTIPGHDNQYVIPLSWGKNVLANSFIKRLGATLPTLDLFDNVVYLAYGKPDPQPPSIYGEAFCYIPNEFIGKKPISCIDCQSSNVATTSDGDALCYNCGSTNIYTYADIATSVYNFYDEHSTIKLFDERIRLQNEFDRHTYFVTKSDIGEQLYKEYLSFIRELKYDNSNYVGSVLNTNDELIKQANELLLKGKQELAKASMLQSTITTTLSSILAQKSDNDDYSKFLVNNYVKVRINEEIYDMRISSISLSYPISENVGVTFTNVVKNSNMASDISEAIKSAASMATTYNYIATQSEQGKEAFEQVEEIKNDGLDASLSAVMAGINQDVVIDDKGILLRNYVPMYDDYSPYQMKLINRNIVMTDDGWRSAKLAIGLSKYDGKDVYGVWADVLVGDIIAGKELRIKNNKNDEDSSVIIDENGITITNGVIKSNDYISGISGTKIDLSNGEIDSKNFKLFNDGSVYMNGTIEANEGFIGDWQIFDGKLVGGNVRQIGDDFILSELITLDPDFAGNGGYINIEHYDRDDMDDSTFTFGTTISLQQIRIYEENEDDSSNHEKSISLTNTSINFYDNISDDPHWTKHGGFLFSAYEENLNTTGNLVPSVNDKYSLGDNDYHWNTLCVNNISSEAELTIFTDIIPHMNNVRTLGDDNHHWKTLYVNDIKLGEHYIDNVFATNEYVQQNYLQLSGGTITGSIITPEDDSKGIIPATNNYGTIGTSNKKFYTGYFNTLYENNVALSDKYQKDIMIKKSTVSTPISIAANSYLINTGSIEQINGYTPIFIIPRDTNNTNICWCRCELTNSSTWTYCVRNCSSSNATNFNPSVTVVYEKI